MNKASSLVLTLAAAVAFLSCKPAPPPAPAEPAGTPTPAATPTANAHGNADGYSDARANSDTDSRRDATHDSATICRFDACRANAIADGDTSGSRWFGKSRPQGSGRHRRWREDFESTA